MTITEKCAAIALEFTNEMIAGYQLLGADGYYTSAEVREKQKSAPAAWAAYAMFCQTVLPSFRRHANLLVKHLIKDKKLDLKPDEQLLVLSLLLREFKLGNCMELSCSAAFGLLKNGERNFRLIILNKPGGDSMGSSHMIVVVGPEESLTKLSEGSHITSIADEQLQIVDPLFRFSGSIKSYLKNSGVLKYIKDDENTQISHTSTIMGMKIDLAHVPKIDIDKLSLIKQSKNFLTYGLADLCSKTGSKHPIFKEGETDLQKFTKMRGLYYGMISEFSADPNRTADIWAVVMGTLGAGYELPLCASSKNTLTARSSDPIICLRLFQTYQDLLNEGIFVKLEKKLTAAGKEETCLIMPAAAQQTQSFQCYAQAALTQYQESFFAGGAGGGMAASAKKEEESKKETLVLTPAFKRFLAKNPSYLQDLMEKKDADTSKAKVTP